MNCDLGPHCRAPQIMRICQAEFHEDCDSDTGNERASQIVGRVSDQARLSDPEKPQRRLREPAYKRRAERLKSAPPPVSESQP